MSPLLAAHRLLSSTFARLPGVHAIGLGRMGRSERVGAHIIGSDVELNEAAARAEHFLSTQGLRDIPVEAMEVRRPVFAVAGPWGPFPPDNSHHEVIVGGISIARPRQGAFADEGGGTACAVVRTSSSNPRGAGRIGVLTNQHVVLDGRDEDAPANRSIMQPPPGPIAGCTTSCDGKRRVIAHMRQNARLRFDVDAAVAELLPGIRWSPEVHRRGQANVPIADVRALTPSDAGPRGVQVWKSGRRTGLTEGRVRSVYVCGKIDKVLFPERHQRPADDNLGWYATFPDDWWVYSHGILIDGCPFAAAGDSGSPVLDQGGSIVGMVFGASAASESDRIRLSPGGPAGPDFAGPGLAFSIRRVEDVMHVEVMTSRNTSNYGTGSGRRRVFDVPPERTLPRPSFQARTEYSTDVVNLPLNVTADLFADCDYDVARTVQCSGWRPRLIAVDDLLSTEGGRTLMGAVARHVTEVRALLASHRRLAAAWRLYGVEEFLARIRAGLHADDEALPSRVRGRLLGDALDRVWSEAAPFASEELSDDYRQLAPRYLALAGLSFSETLVAMSASRDGRGSGSGVRDDVG